MNMQQNLPLNYPEIITKFLQQRVDRGDFSELSTDNTLEEFDKVEFDGLIYRLDVHQEEEIVCIKEELNNQVYNITKYDYTELYKDMPELLALLNYIESQVVFTVTDWCTYFANYAPIYNGMTIDLLKTSTDTYVVRHKVKGNTTGFKIINGTVYRVSCINILKVSNSGNPSIQLDTVLDDVDKHPHHTAEMEQALLYLFNNEFTLSNFMPSGRGDLIPVSVMIPVYTTVHVVFGIEVTVNHADNSLSFNWDNKQFNVTSAGHVSVSLIEEVKPAPKLAGIMFHTSVWARVTTDNEVRLARAVVQLLNQVYGE